MTVEGGELEFIKQMIDESDKIRSKIKWFTSLVGIKSDAEQLLSYIKSKFTQDQVSCNLQTIVQGYTRRWILSWTFLL